MNVPQGNAIALQQLRPVENKTGDILSEFTFQLIKEKKAKDAAALKSMVDSGATMDDIINKINPKYVNTIYQFQPKLNEQADNIMNLKAEYGKIGVTDTPEKLARKRELYNQFTIANAEYERQQTFLANPDTNQKLSEKMKLLSEGKLFDGDKSTAALKAFTSGLLVQKKGEDGRFYVEYADNPSIPFSESNKVSENINDFLDNVLNSQSDVTDQVIKDAKNFNKTKDVTIGTDNGYRKNVKQSIQFDKEGNKKSVMVYFGLDPNKDPKEQFINPDTLSQNLRQYFYKYVGDKRNISSGEDIAKAVDSYLELAKANANEKYSNITDINLPSSSGGSGSKNSEDTQLFTPNNTILKIAGQDGLTRYYKQPSLTYYTTYGNDKNQQRVGITVFWNPNGKNANGGKGAVNYGVTKTSNDGKETVTVPVKDLSAVYNYLDSNSVEQKTKMRNMIIDATNVVSQQMKVAGYQIKDVNQLKNYKVDFDDVMKRGANVNKKQSSPLKSQSVLPSAN